MVTKRHERDAKNFRAVCHLYGKPGRWGQRICKDFQSSIVRENDMTALFANQPPSRKGGHGMELVIDNTIKTADLFLQH